MASDKTSLPPGKVSPSLSYGSTKEIVDDKDDTSLDDPEACCLKCCAPEAKPGVAILRILGCVLAGIIFGWCLEKSRVFEPASIRLQMVFKRWVMLKMFLAAVASGQLVMALLSVLPSIKTIFLQAMAEFGGCFRDKSIATSIVGPFVLGCGMTLSGACPGMVLAQVGAWAKNAIFTFIGVLLGSLIYGFIAPYIVRISRPKKSFQTLTLHEAAKLPYFSLALPMGLLLTLTVVLMEVYIPWEDDIDCWDRNEYATPCAGNNVMIMKSWIPGVGGAIIGLLQVLIVISVGDTLGGSSSYVTLVSQWAVCKRAQELFPYFARARCGIGNWWQVFYVLAAVLGALLSALSSSSLATTSGVGVAGALVGGVLLLFGARFAAGCTSGHGLSGMGLLYWFSFIAVPAMFAGAIVTGFSMQATGELCNYDCIDKYYCTDYYNNSEACGLWDCTGFTLQDVDYQC